MVWWAGHEEHWVTQDGKSLTEKDRLASSVDLGVTGGLSAGGAASRGLGGLTVERLGLGVPEGR